MKQKSTATWPYDSMLNTFKTHTDLKIVMINKRHLWTSCTSLFEVLDMSCTEGYLQSTGAAFQQMPFLMHQWLMCMTLRLWTMTVPITDYSNNLITWWCVFIAWQYTSVWHNIQETMEVWQQSWIYLQWQDTKQQTKCRS